MSNSTRACKLLKCTEPLLLRTHSKHSTCLFLKYPAMPSSKAKTSSCNAISIFRNSGNKCGRESAVAMKHGHSRSILMYLRNPTSFHWRSGTCICLLFVANCCHKFRNIQHERVVFNSLQVADIGSRLTGSSHSLYNVILRGGGKWQDWINNVNKLYLLGMVYTS